MISFFNSSYQSLFIWVNVRWEWSVRRTVLRWNICRGTIHILTHIHTYIYMGSTINNNVIPLHSVSWVISSIFRSLLQLLQSLKNNENITICISIIKNYNKIKWYCKLVHIFSNTVTQFWFYLSQAILISCFWIIIAMLQTIT